MNLGIAATKTLAELEFGGFHYFSQHFSIVIT
jgi:hypothetical protein